MRIYRVIFLFWFLLLSLVNSAQQVSNIHFEQVGKQIHINYDLSGDPYVDYSITVFCSDNDDHGWGNALTSISVDVGAKQSVGKNKLIIWDVLSERENLSGQIKFKIEASASYIDRTGSFVDNRDKHSYNWVKIGDQVWMAENLNYEISEDSWVYNNKSKNAQVYGRLYTWESATKACPEGWHLPTIEEWEILIEFLGKDYIAGGEMKQTGIKYWRNPNFDATNSSGFSALPGGQMDNVGEFSFLEESANFWSSTRSKGSSVWIKVLDYNSSDIFNDRILKKFGLSVRCIAD